MSIGIPIITPPTDDPDMKDYLSQMMILINAALQQSDNLNPVGQLPDVYQDGMIRYFSTAILPEITAPGFWGVHGGVWVPIAI